jgi:hypothetical protein
MSLKTDTVANEKPKPAPAFTVTDDLLKTFTRGLLLGLVLYNLPLVAVMAWVKPHWIPYYVAGCGLAVVFGASLLWCVRLGSVGLVLASTFGRLVTIPFLSGLIGQFEFVPTLVVFAGCLSYKWILLIERVRYRLRQRRRPC